MMMCPQHLHDLTRRKGAENAEMRWQRMRSQMAIPVTKCLALMLQVPTHFPDETGALHGDLRWKNCGGLKWHLWPKC